MRKQASHGSNRRQRQVGEDMRRILGEMLSRQEIPDPELNGMSVTVTEVRVSADLREAKVFFLPLGGRDAERAGDALERNRGLLQRAVQRKFAPRLRFVPDSSFDRFDAIDRLLRNAGRGQDDVAPGSS